MLAVENVHWIDPTSEEWLVSLVERLGDTPMLLLMTYRPGYQPPWLTHSAATQMALSRLRPDDSLLRAAVGAAGGAAPGPCATEHRGHGGRQSLLSGGLCGRWGSTATPARLPGPCRNRAGGTGGAHRSAALAPRSASSRPPPSSAPTCPYRFCRRNRCRATRPSIADLVAPPGREFLYETRQLPAPTYTFKHALTREAAYRSLLASTRQQLHQRIAQVLEARFADVVETQPELLAHHYTEAGCAEQAVAYWQRAGYRARQRVGDREAITHFRKGVDVLQALPHTRERIRQEVDMFSRALGGAVEHAGPPRGG